MTLSIWIQIDRTRNNLTGNPTMEYLLVLVLYFFPAWLANYRYHRNTLAILILNLCLGWTALGWIAALIWACTNNLDLKEKAKWQRTS
jgi:T4 superinfection immunity protein